MTGKLTRPRSLAAAPSLVKRPVVLAGFVILSVAAATTGAWLTQPPDKAPPRIVEAPPAPAPAISPAVSPMSASAATIALPESPAPPAPTSADIARSGPPPAAAATADEPLKPLDWAALPLDELRAKANADDITAMEELARRLIQGVGVTKDQQAGAGWLLRAAQRGSAQSAFNVAVMYERGFVVERDSSKAVEWYGKAVTANLAIAKHNLALLLRDGKGAPRDGKKAVELLRSAAHQGMSASMFALGDIYERGDAAPKDAATALAWFAITAEFERQTNRDTETALARTAAQRSQTLQRILTPAELEQAQQLGQREFKLIVEALSPPKPPTAPAVAPPVEMVAPLPALPQLADVDPPGWPKATNDQIRVIQQALVDLRYLRDKPDGALGPMTRTAIRAFQRSVALRETGEPTKDVYAALRDALGSRDIVANSPLPPPPKEETPKPEMPKVELPKVEIPKVEVAKADPVQVEAPKVEPPQAEPPKSEASKVESPVPPRIEATNPPPAQVAAAVEPPKPAPPKIEPAKPSADAWPAAPADQVKAVQKLLRDLNFSRDAPDGLIGPGTRAAIRDYERAAGLAVTGEPSKALFESLKELRLLMAPKAN